mmetsp:Transcript_102727/g.257577  ORF Transcript_102727/g.257577 Transcript_102727/m.257577 type:complete len:218 (-) Transcript_102727:381-1034(-)
MAALELKFLRPREPWQWLCAVGCRHDSQRNRKTVLRRCMVLTLDHRLFHHSTIRQHGNVVGVVHLLELQLHSDFAMPRILVNIVFRACQGALFVLAHVQQSLVDDPAERPKIPGANDVVKLGPVLDDRAVLRGCLQGNAHLRVFWWVFPRLHALLDDGFDDTVVAKQVVLGNPADQLNLKYEHGVWWDCRWLALLAIRELGLDCEPGLFALGHRSNA